MQEGNKTGRNGNPIVRVVDENIHDLQPEPWGRLRSVVQMGFLICESGGQSRPSGTYQRERMGSRVGRKGALDRKYPMHSPVHLVCLARQGEGEKPWLCG